MGRVLAFGVAMNANTYDSLSPKHQKLMEWVEIDALTVMGISPLYSQVRYIVVKIAALLGKADKKGMISTV